MRTLASTDENAARGIAPALTAAESELFVRAAAGVCDSSLTTTRARIEELMQSYVDTPYEDRRAWIEQHAVWPNRDMATGSRP